jgi:hypothetical protein
VITLHDDQGRQMFAFDGRTDPDEVVLAVAWAWPQRIPLCDWPCPGHEGKYCLECHTDAWLALCEARRRGDLRQLPDHA